MAQSFRTILIIDDSPEDRELYRRYLARDTEFSYTFLEASLGQQGLELWHHHHPDAVLLDYRLPDLDGLAFLAQLSAATQQPCLPVIFITGQGNEAIAVQAMKAGAQDYLIKGQITPASLHLAIAGAISTVQLNTQLHQRIEREHLVTQITRKIYQTLDLTEILQTTVTEVRQFLQTDRVLIFRLQSEGWGTVTTESVGPGWTALLSTSYHDPCLKKDYLTLFGQGLVTSKPDIDDGSIEPCHRDLLAKLQVRANLVVPILQTDQLWGLLIAHHCTAPRPWEPLEIDLLKELAMQVGIAIQQAELYAQTRRELSARNQIQTILEESEERFRTLSAAAPIGICQISTDGICLYSNPSWLEMSGLSAENSLGTGWLDAVHPDDQPTLRTAWNAYIEGGSDDLPAFRLLTPQGELRWVAARIAALRAASGEITGHVCTQEDITERKQAEQALRDSEQRLQTILDNSPAAIYIMDPQNTFLLVNRFCADLVAQNPEELVGKSIYDVWPAEIADAFAVNNRIVLDTGQLLQVEESTTLADGIHTYITIKFPLCDATGTPYALCGISTDITEKKQLEAQFYRAQRLESLGTLASGIAHDLNNVFTPILTMTQLLRLHHPNLDARSQEMLKVLEDSAKRGASMINQILTFARGTGGDRISLEVAPLLQDVIDVVQQTLPKSISIRYTSPDLALGWVSADATCLHQVFMNLCLNARDAMPDGGMLDVSLEPCVVDQPLARISLNAQVGPHVVVTIADTGAGIPPDVQEHMFEPFFTTKMLGQGTGLGLATVLGIVETYGGFLQVLSEIGQGTQIKVYLPSIKAAAERPDQLQDPLDGAGERVLVVDDDMAVQISTQSLLESHQYTTFAANDGPEAIALYTQHLDEIKAIILDIMMPNMDGGSLIRRLKEINPTVKILAMSGLTTNREDALAAGASAFVAKPYSLEHFLATLQHLITTPTTLA